MKLMETLGGKGCFGLGIEVIKGVHYGRGRLE